MATGITIWKSAATHGASSFRSKIASTELKLAPDAFTIKFMATQTKWYSTPQVILLFLGIGVLLFVSGFGIGKWFGSGSLRSQEDLVFAEYKAGEATVKIYGRDVLPKLADRLRDLEREKYRLKREFTESLIFEKASLKTPTEPARFSEEELKKFAEQRNLVVSKLSPQQRKDLEGNFRIHKVQASRRSELQSLLDSEETVWNIPITYHRSQIKVGIGSVPAFKFGRGRGTLVVFGNYHCPSCPSLWTKLDSLMQVKGRGANLHIRYRVMDGDAPIVRAAAMGAFCANDQGLYAAYHNAVVAAPPRELSDFHRTLEQLGIKRDIFDSCLAAKATEARLNRDLLDAGAIGIASPTIAVINGTPIEADEPLTEYLTLLGH